MRVGGRKNVGETVGVRVEVGVAEAVLVKMDGVRLRVGVSGPRVTVSVIAANVVVMVAVGVGVWESGASETATQPRQ